VLEVARRVDHLLDTVDDHRLTAAGVDDGFDPDLSTRSPCACSSAENRTAKVAHSTGSVIVIEAESIPARCCSGEMAGTAVATGVERPGAVRSNSMTEETPSGSSVRFGATTTQRSRSRCPRSGRRLRIRPANTRDLTPLGQHHVFVARPPHHRRTRRARRRSGTARRTLARRSTFTEEDVQSVTEPAAARPARSPVAARQPAGREGR
jgi:hypothetical protein